MATLSGHASYLEHAAQFNLELEECTERRPMLVLRTKSKDLNNWHQCSFMIIQYYYS